MCEPVQVLQPLGLQVASSSVVRVVRVVRVVVVVDRFLCDVARVVNALAKFGRRLPALRPNVLVLLNRCLHDNDDEVRDRATFHLRILQEDVAYAGTLLDTPFVVPVENLGMCTRVLLRARERENILIQCFGIGLIEIALRQYLAAPSAQPFDLAVVPTDAPQQVVKTKAEHTRQSRAAAQKTAGGDTYAELLAQVPELAGLGALFSSSKPVELTESETEYTVSCVKHVYPEHVVFQVGIGRGCK
jgi:coatomer subunit gamma